MLNRHEYAALERYSDRLAKQAHFLSEQAKKAGDWRTAQKMSFAEAAQENERRYFAGR